MVPRERHRAELKSIIDSAQNVGVERYQACIHKLAGTRWQENSVPFEQDKRCKKIAEGPEDQAMPLCFLCHIYDL